MTSTFMSFPLPDLKDKTPFEPTVISKWLRLCQKQGLSFLLICFNGQSSPISLHSEPYSEASQVSDRAGRACVVPGLTAATVFWAASEGVRRSDEHKCIRSHVIPHPTDTGARSPCCWWVFSTGLRGMERVKGVPGLP